MDDTQRQRIADACRFIDSVREAVVSELRIEEQSARSKANREQHRVGHFSLLVTETLLFQATAILKELSEWSRLKNGPTTRDTTLQRMQLAALEDAVGACFSIDRAQAKNALRALWKEAPVTKDLIIRAIGSGIAGREKVGDPALVDLVAACLTDVADVHVRDMVFYAAKSAASERARRRPAACLRPGWLSEEVHTALEREALLSFAVPLADNSVSGRRVMAFIGDVRDTEFSVVVWMPKPATCTAEEVRAGLCRQFGLPPGGVILEESRVLDDDELSERLFQPIARRMNWPGFGSTPHPFFAMSVELSFFMSGQGEAAVGPPVDTEAGAGSDREPRGVEDLLKAIGEAPDRITVLERVLAMAPFDRARVGKHLGMSATPNAFELTGQIVDHLRADRGDAPATSARPGPPLPHENGDHNDEENI